MILGGSTLAFVGSYASYEHVDNAQFGFAATIAGFVVGSLAWLWAIAKAAQAEDDADRAKRSEEREREARLRAEQAQATTAQVVGHLGDALSSGEPFVNDPNQLNSDVLDKLVELRGSSESPAEVKEQVYGSYRKAKQGPSHLLLVLKDGSIYFRYSKAGGAALGGQIQTVRPPAWQSEKLGQQAVK